MCWKNHGVDSQKVDEGKDFFFFILDEREHRQGNMWMYIVYRERESE